MSGSLSRHARYALIWANASSREGVWFCHWNGCHGRSVSGDAPWMVVALGSPSSRCFLIVYKSTSNRQEKQKLEPSRSDQASMVFAEARADADDLD
jgi:hypothetical protein